MELFRSENLVVRQCAGFGDACVVVTFDSFTDFRTLDRPGFGEHFFQAVQIDAIHVIPRDNDWYQYPEMLEAMALVHAATRRYGRVVTYGSSMGAYAGHRLAGLVGAHAVMALSPQFSIDPAVVPWEFRWPHMAARFRPVWERTLPFPEVAEVVVLYDPENLDQRHIALLAAQARFESVLLPGAGHPVTGFLADIGLLQPAILDLCRGTLDRAALAATAQARSLESPQFLLAQAAALSKRRTPRRLELCREAMRLAPENAGVVSRLAVELRLARLGEEALEHHRRAIALAPGHPHLLLEYSKTLERFGDREGALAIMEEIDALTQGAPLYQVRLQQLRRAAGGTGAALLPTLLKSRWAKPLGR